MCVISVYLILKYVLSFVIDILAAKYVDGKESVNVFRMIISVPEFSAKQEETAQRCTSRGVWLGA